MSWYDGFRFIKVMGLYRLAYVIWGLSVSGSHLALLSDYSWLRAGGKKSVFETIFGGTCGAGV